MTDKNKLILHIHHTTYRNFRTPSVFYKFFRH